MPIYEYQCTKCGHELESLQKISDPPLTDCPECGAAALQKLVSAAGFRLKGGGWYETDFKSGSKKNVAESSSSSESSSKPEKKAAGGCGSGGCGCH
ncbi:FmdB family zinc ribbon protein [Thiohalobacter thiocyanaticus]|uniref:Zinc ribbon domain-containing protein n=1 Tax=Thiohalobacter thiocyanaticus TaxID=585455 RepID=A0A426QLE6_9GAMM|nr:zinc ribbon domain-containing protein [Thiohalobacter thiocyanaticus]RRQ22559.1 zinc ribbon domain-containing protein [Thiohalobacter thiocyanaticus]